MAQKIAADAVVIGAGLTGLRTALGLADAGMSVAVLEGKAVGYGASGRSGGQCNPMWRATPDQLCQRLGEKTAEMLVALTLSATDDLMADVNRYGVSCDFVQNGWVQAAHCNASASNLEHLGDAWNSVGAKICLLDRLATQKRSGSPDYAMSLFHPNGGHVHPLSLTRGFAEAAERLGVSIFEDTSAVGIQKNGSQWTVATPQGSVVTKRVVFATNAYSDGLWPGLRETIVPMVTTILATQPLDAATRSQVLPGNVTIADTRRAIYYARYDRDFRLVFGCVGSVDDVAALGGLGRLRRGLGTTFPVLKDASASFTWSGRIAVTRDMMPRLYEPESGIFAGLGYSGRGILMTSVMARALVKRILGAPESELPFPISPIERFPLQPIVRRLVPYATPAMELRDKLDTWIGR
ncbi:FAD-binding oxidoreductase [uncultured Tateyamaria sp.]|uniref:NAD(P)/FAD-dependent oxidoreductase n=1 Tax=uncultured Tateyamaria sp. TaxID=455651 RepID=UPI00262C91C0|nr:FAD-binding oxidoreductase [uncultured Tateyamaria sp.]